MKSIDHDFTTYHLLACASLLPKYDELNEVLPTNSNLGLLLELYPIEPLEVFGHIIITVAMMPSTRRDQAYKALRTYIGQKPIQYLLEEYAPNHEGTAGDTRLWDSLAALYENLNAQTPIWRELIGGEELSRLWGALEIIFTRWYLTLVDHTPAWENTYGFTSYQEIHDMMIPLRKALSYA